MQRHVESCGEVERCKEAQRHGTGGPTSMGGGKNQDGYLGSEGSQPQSRLPSPGFQYQEDKSPHLLAMKTSRGWDGGRNCGILRRLF